MKIVGIYSITNIVNNKKLIGQSKDIKTRWNKHKSLLNRNKHENPYFQNSWNKYGKDKFIFEIVLLCHCEELNTEEKRAIQEFHSNDRLFGYNLTEGGKRPFCTLETREKLRKANIGKHLSEETKRKISNSIRGEKHPWFGKNHTEETKRKIGTANNKEHRGQISEETKIKMSESKKGSKHPLFGKPRSEETKRKIREKLVLNHHNLGESISVEHKKKLLEGYLAYRSRIKKI